jgi:hypothetical protein
MWWSKKKQKQEVPTVNDVVQQIKMESWFIELVEITAEKKVKKTMSDLVKYFEAAYQPYAQELMGYGDRLGEERDAREGMASFGRYVDSKVQKSFYEFVNKQLDNRVKIEVDKVIEELKTYLNQEKLLDDIVKRIQKKQLS